MAGYLTSVMRTLIKLWIFWFLLSAGADFTFAQSSDSDLIATVKETYGLNAEQTNGILSSVGTLGASSFSLANIVASLFFGAVGFFAFVYGKKQGNYKALSIGIVLMVYPYFISNTVLLYTAGVGLCVALYFWRD